MECAKLLSALSKYMESRNYEYQIIKNGEDIEIISPSFPINLEEMRNLTNYLSEKGFNVISSRIFVLTETAVVQIVIAFKPPYLVRINISPKRYKKPIFSYSISGKSKEQESTNFHPQNKIERIIKLRRIIIDFCLGEMKEEEFIEEAKSLGLNGKKLLEFIDKTFRELDGEKWSRLLKTHPFAPEAFQTYWKIHGKPIVVSRSESPRYLKSIGLRDADIIIWVAKEISCT